MLRHPTFGDYEPAMVACGFVQGHGAGLGPLVRAFEPVDYLVWLLSRDSLWLPLRHRTYLLEGMKQWAVWPWRGQNADSDYSGEHAGKLRDLLLDTSSQKQIRSFKLSNDALADIRDRTEYSRALLGFSDSTDELASALVRERIPQSWFAAQDRRRRKRRKGQSPSGS
jgi:hypothetical protein